MKKNDLKKVYTKDKEVKVMPTIEMIEYERVAYIKEMEDYLRKLKNMGHEEAKKKSHENLLKSNIIGEDGEFTERYHFSGLNIHMKR